METESATACHLANSKVTHTSCFRMDQAAIVYMAQQQQCEAVRCNAAQPENDDRAKNDCTCILAAPREEIRLVACSQS